MFSLFFKILTGDINVTENTFAFLPLSFVGTISHVIQPHYNQKHRHHTDVVII